MQDKTINRALIQMWRNKEPGWEMKAANLLKAELKRQGVTYAQLAERIGEKEVNIRNKLSLGKFSAAFMLQCLDAVGATELRLYPI